METAVSYYRSRGGRHNFIPWLFAAVVLGLLGWQIYSFIRDTLTDQSNNYIKVNLKALGSFDFDSLRGTMADVPECWRQLDGSCVMLEGQVFCPTESDGVKHFEFVYGIAGLRGAPRVRERIFARIPRGTVADIPNSDYCRVTGILHVGIERNSSGQISSLYTMDVEKLGPM